MPVGSADTIAAPATPAGESALALLRVSGPMVQGLLPALFGAAPPPRTAVHADYRDRAGRLVDDVVGTFFAGPHSYTGEDTLELSCHGSPYIVQRLLADLFARGCRPAGPGEFTRRAFLHGRMDLSQAEAVMDLIHARGERALEAAQRQLRGALGRHLAAAIDGLLATLAQVEAYLDFPDEDLPPADRARLDAGLAAQAAALDRLLATGRYGELLRQGVRTVLVGAPNAGKSSLLNRLLGWERALVGPEPGTTRDYLEEARVVGPHCIRFVDTAGLRTAPAGPEAGGVERAVAHAVSADLILWVLDAAAGPPPPPPPPVAERLARGDVIAVWNKTDLAPPGPLPALARGRPVVAVSARDGRGLPELEAAIVAAVDAHRLDLSDELIVVNARHAHDLAEARASLDEARRQIAAGVADELVAAELRGALEALGRIAGKVDNERMLDKLFANFCIGK